MTPPHPRSTLFPYTTLFRSLKGRKQTLVDGIEVEKAVQGIPRPKMPIHQRCIQLPALNLSVVEPGEAGVVQIVKHLLQDRKSTRLNSSHGYISYAVFCLKKK